MFKLLKELTRPPVTLAPPTQLHDPSSSLAAQPTYAPRQRSRSIVDPAGNGSGDAPRGTAGSGVGRNGTAAGKEASKPEVEVEESSEMAKPVVEILKTLDDSEGGVMRMVEVSLVSASVVEVGEASMGLIY
jgi:hypothetical protein